jgi:hypothetical protein
MIRYRGVEIDRKNRTISNRGVTIKFGKYSFELLSALLLAIPKTKYEITDIVYRNNVDGGPLSGAETIEVLMCQRRSDIKRLNLAMLRSGPVGFRHYSLEPN